MVAVYLVTHALAHPLVSKLTFTQLRSCMKLILLLRLSKYMLPAEKANPKFAFSAATLSSKKFLKKHTHNSFAAAGRHQENVVNSQTHSFQSLLPSYVLGFLLLLN